jgi:hypothetical protein
MNDRLPRLVALSELAVVIRSKNSGPYELTLDVIFRNKDDYLRLKERDFFTPALIAGLYQTDPEDVFKIVYFDPALAVKATMRRPVPSGALGDTDIYGAQQHAPLLGLMVDA